MSQNELGPNTHPLLTQEAIQHQADRLGGLPLQRIDAQRDFAAEMMHRLPGDFDPDVNPQHARLAAQLRGALHAGRDTWAASEADAAADISRKGSDDVDPPAFALRVDGIIELVNGAGQGQIRQGGVPDQTNILRSFAPAQPKSVERTTEPFPLLPPTPTGRTRRRVQL